MAVRTREPDSPTLGFQSDEDAAQEALRRKIYEALVKLLRTGEYSAPAATVKLYRQVGNQGPLIAHILAGNQRTFEVCTETSYKTPVYRLVPALRVMEPEPLPYALQRKLLLAKALEARKKKALERADTKKRIRAREKELEAEERKVRLREDMERRKEVRRENARLRKLEILADPEKYAKYLADRRRFAKHQREKHKATLALKAKERWQRLKARLATDPVFAAEYKAKRKASVDQYDKKRRGTSSNS
jgi:hypothetical protein